MSSDQISVYLEFGRKRIFAAAVDWPGWCRSGRDEPTALQALMDSQERYAQVTQRAAVDFVPASQASDFLIVERLEGNLVTDFGAPGLIPTCDLVQVDANEFARQARLLDACWEILSETVRLANGLPLRKGPRGGGRELPKIVEHVLGGNDAYLQRINASRPPSAAGDLQAALAAARQQTKAALQTGFLDGIPERGPRGGSNWPLRYFVRRATWHILDHAWEIEDRVIPGE